MDCRKKGFDWAAYARRLWKRYQKSLHECVHKVCVTQSTVWHCTGHGSEFFSHLASWICEVLPLPSSVSSWTLVRSMLQLRLVWWWAYSCGDLHSVIHACTLFDMQTELMCLLCHSFRVNDVCNSGLLRALTLSLNVKVNLKGKQCNVSKIRDLVDTMKSRFSLDPEGQEPESINTDLLVSVINAVLYASHLDLAIWDINDELPQANATVKQQSSGFCPFNHFQPITKI